MVGVLFAALRIKELLFGDWLDGKFEGMSE